MSANLFAVVDQALVASVKAIREAMDTISTPNNRWWIEEETPSSVIMGYNPTPSSRVPDINNVLFEFPKIAKLELFPEGGGEMVCLYPFSRKEIQKGLHWSGGRLLHDDFKDWERFWKPLEKALQTRYQLSPLVHVE